MSIIKQLSDVLKEVFWIKSSKKKKRSSPVKRSRKKISKKVAKKSPPKKKVVVSKKVEAPIKAQKPLKAPKPIKPSKAPKIPKVPKVKKVELDPNLVRVGEITHYFDRIKVCVVKITHGTILIGDKLTFVSEKTKFVQKVWSMQIESLDVKVAKKGQLIGLKVDKPIQVGDIVYK